MLAVAILFSVFGISAYAWNEEPFEDQNEIITTLNGDIFVCHSVISIYDGYAHYETTVEFYVPNAQDPDEPYPNYVPSNTAYDVAFNIMPVYKIYGEDIVYGDMYETPVHRPLGNGHVTAAISDQCQLESMASYEYFSTETFITITDQNNATYEALLCSVSYFWNLH